MSIPREGSRDTGDGILVSRYPDWCRVGNAVIPFTIHALQDEDAGTAATVRQTGKRSHTSGSLILCCHGDEAGAGLGVKSGTKESVCQPKTWSQTVRFEGKGVVRHNDEWWMNNKNTTGKLAYVENTEIFEKTPPIEFWRNEQNDFFLPKEEGANTSDTAGGRAESFEALQMQRAGKEVMSDAMPHHSWEAGRQYAQAAPAPAPSSPLPPSSPPPGTQSVGNVIYVEGWSKPTTTSHNASSGLRYLRYIWRVRKASPIGILIAGMQPSEVGDATISGAIKQIKKEAAEKAQEMYAEGMPEDLVDIWYENTLRIQLSEYGYDVALSGKQQAPAVQPLTEDNNRTTSKCRELVLCFMPRRDELSSSPQSEESMRYTEEFKRQLALQNRELNQLAPAEALNNMTGYLRDPEGMRKKSKPLQEKTRKKYQALLEKKYKGLTGSTERIAREMKSVAALHNPDMIAGGHWRSVGDPALALEDRVGLSSVNSSLGSQWRGRANRLLMHYVEQVKNRCPRVQVQLRYCASVVNQPGVPLDQ